MATKTPDKFSLYVPDEQEPDREMPSRLELEDPRAKKIKQSSLPAGAYNPYEKPSDDTQNRPRLQKRDLRKLSEWIRLRQEVDALNREDKPPTKAK